MNMWYKASLPCITSTSVTVQWSDMSRKLAYHIPHLSKQDQHAVIQFLDAERCEPAKTHWWMQAVWLHLYVKNNNERLVCDNAGPHIANIIKSKVWLPHHWDNEVGSQGMPNPVKCSSETRCLELFHQKTLKLFKKGTLWLSGMHVLVQAMTVSEINRYYVTDPGQVSTEPPSYNTHPV
jgi:hypothetical protein